MNANLLKLKLYLKLLALKALPDIERRALEAYERTGTVVHDKRQFAREYVLERYAQATAKIPGLRDTKLDDLAVGAAIDETLDWAWDQLGDVLNSISHDPVVTAPDLPKGGEAQ
ncbi:hypothetical protein [Deinococcus radiotolerans]|uniref:HEPN domain-containing protein n=1 Tax=Deinococcus radiotolerans TaxID=1309407 RepID=A0ABQ2FQ72_9DEIO|nr:hypothetical protein [Deinococcus radiotolerans]GGL16086.1 hypothetical protein GCM10010844_38690 [Deinococcus radiotolerans]